MCGSPIIVQSGGILQVTRLLKSLGNVNVAYLFWNFRQNLTFD
jgi:hypothetical protein